ncbi:MAG TPA: thioesterase family protein [Longimicrobiales bacterium]|nr:thioesterase family protein [Longimicrobiales bacterium]
MSGADARPFSVELRVRYGETDQMGVVYHAHYLSWCDVARTEYIRALGTSYAELERQGLLLAVTEVNVRYHASARYDDDIRIEVWPETVQSRAVAFRYRVLRAPDGQRLATVSTRLTAINRDGAPRRLPRELLQHLRAAVRV